MHSHYEQADGRKHGEAVEERASTSREPKTTPTCTIHYDSGDLRYYIKRCDVVVRSEACLQAALYWIYLRKSTECA